MKMNSKAKKAINIILIVIASLAIAFFIACLVLQWVIPDFPLSQWAKTYVIDVTMPVAPIKPTPPADLNDPAYLEALKIYDEKLLAYNTAIDNFNGAIRTLISSGIFIVLIFSLSKILRTIFKARIAKNAKRKTVITLLDGVVKYGSAIAIFIYVLIAFGVKAEAIFGAAGVLTLVVGLGAQTLIGDIIAGVFLVFENEFAVDETISIDGFRGKVIEIGIRTTKLLDAAGNIKIINHSAIANVVNLSRELSLAVVDCDFPYDVPIEFVENLFEKHFDGIKERIPEIVEGPYYKGVCMYKDSNVTIKIVAKCHEDDRFQVERDLMREYRQIITANGIDIAFPQVVINQAKENAIKVTKKDIKHANEFSEEQKELSAGLDEQER